VSFLHQVQAGCLWAVLSLQSFTHGQLSYFCWLLLPALAS
jgi:hypothetical protein